MRIPSHRFSEVLRRLAEPLSDHKNGPEMVQVLANHEHASGDRSGFDIAEAVYWIGHDFHGGQWCPLYAALCATEFRPGMLARGPETGSVAEMIYQQLATLVE
jgi:hypothetical protein